MGTSATSVAEPTTGAWATTGEEAGAVQMGTFDDTGHFSPYAPAQEIVLHVGTQSAFHILVDVALGDVPAASDYVLALAAWDGTREVTRTQLLRAPEKRVVDGLAPVRELLLVFSESELADGRELRLTLEVQTGTTSEPVGTDEATVIPRLGLALAHQPAEVHPVPARERHLGS